MLASFPAGLVIYWTWNNLLSIGQQSWIMRLEKQRGAKGGTPVAAAALPGAAPAGAGAGAKAKKR